MTATWRTLALPGAVALAAVALLAPVARAQPRPPLKAALSTEDLDRLLADADAAERGGKCDKALDLYFRAFLSGRATPEVRDHIRYCLRAVRQDERHRDPAFQQHILSLPVSDAVTLYAEVVERINKLYAVRERAGVDALFAAGLDELDRSLSDPAFRQLHLPDATELKVAKFRQSIRDGWRAKLPITPREAQAAAREVATAAQRQLGMKNGSAVVLELLCGACAGLDEYTAYVSPGRAKPSAGTAVAELATYGLLAALHPDGLFVDAVVPGSWAAVQTTIRKGALVAKLNGRSLARGTLATLNEAFRAAGMAGHDLELTPADDDSPVTVRLPLTVPTVYGAEMLSPKGGVGYLRLAAFTETTPRELEEAVMELKARGMRALVLDLRGNPGGSFAAAVDVARLFLPAGVVATTQGQSGEFADRVFSSDSGMAALDLPLVLVVDTRTMSAAEVFAAGMKDNQRATLVGLPTFGKGLVQSPVRLRSVDAPQELGLPSGKSGVLVLTVASVCGPHGEPLHGAGVVPDITEATPERQLALAAEKALALLGGPSTGMGLMH